MYNSDEDEEEKVDFFDKSCDSSQSSNRANKTSVNDSQGMQLLPKIQTSADKYSKANDFRDRSKSIAQFFNVDIIQTAEESSTLKRLKTAGIQHQLDMLKKAEQMFKKAEKQQRPDSAKSDIVVEL